MPPPETVAIAEEPLLQVPPGEASLKVVAAPWHTMAVPPIASGNGSIVTVAFTLQLPPSEYTTEAVPAAIPVTVPAKSPTETVVAALVHAPPVVALLKVVVAPKQTTGIPPMGPGAVLTNTLAVM